MKRLGQVIRVRPESIAEYERLHANPWPQVNAAMRHANIRNYSIYRFGELLFAYLEYVGDDLAGDMASLAINPEIQRWLALTDPLQEPFSERAAGDWWLSLPEIFHTD